MPIIKARSSSIINSVDLRGTPTAPTAEKTVNTTQIASTAYVRTAITDIINASPALLDTLSELAAAIGNDENFSTTVAASIATKLALAGGTMAGSLVLAADPTDSLEAATKQYVDSLVNNQMIYSTDDVPEGTSLYYTDARVRAALTLVSDNTTVLSYNSVTGQFDYNHPTSDGILEGSTNQYFTTARSRLAISLNSDDNQILSYGSSTGEFTFTTPDTDKIVEGATNQYFTTSRARVAISAGTNISYDSSTGIISSVAAVESVNGQTGIVVLDTDNITEGAANLYHTVGRVRSAVSLVSSDTNTLSYSATSGAFTYVKPNSDGIAEGSTNQYFTNARARLAISVTGDLTYNSGTGVLGFNLANHDTDDIAEGATNQYFTNARARGAISLTTDTADVMGYDSALGEFTFTLANVDSGEIVEGSNLYYTDTRARAAISATGWQISYNSGTGVITMATPTTTDVAEGTSLYFTQARARSAVSLTTSNAGVMSYDSATGVFNFDLGAQDTDDIAEGATNLYYTDERVDDRVANLLVSGTNIGLVYDDVAGTLTIDGPTSTTDIAEGVNQYFTATRARGAVSAVDAGGDGSFSYDSATGAFTYTGPDAAEVRAHFSATTSTGVTLINGAIALAAIPNASLTNSDVTINGTAIALGGNATFDTDAISEGTTNEYFTVARAQAAISVSGDLTYAGGVVGFALSNHNTDDLIEGATNKYFSDTLARAAISATGDLTYNSTTGVMSFTDAVTSVNTKTGAVVLTTDDVAEGTTNEYFTVAKAQAAITAGTGVTVTSGVVSIGQAVGTADNVTFNDVVVSGDLTVNGTLTAINSVDLTVTDKNITIADGSANAAAADGAGITVDGANATITYVAGTDTWDFNKTVKGTFSGPLTGNVTGNLTGNVTGQVSDISNHSTDTLAEGATNKYFSDALARAAVSLTTSDAAVLSYDSATGVFAFDMTALNTDGVSEGATNLYYTDERVDDRVAALVVAGSNITVTYDDAAGTLTIDGPTSTTAITEGVNQYFTTTRARGAVSAVDGGGDGSFSYDSATGVFTYTGPSAAEVQAHFSATTSTGVTLIGGAIALASIPNSSLTNSDVTINGTAIALGSSATFETNDIAESQGAGTNNLYFTDARARNAVSLTTSNSAVMSYDSATGDFDFDLTALSTDSVAEGATNLYYTDERVDDRIDAMLTAGSNITLTYDDAAGTMTIAGPTSTTAITEGTNLYYTDSRVRAAVSLVTNDAGVMSYNAGTGVFTFDSTGLNTDEIVEGATNQYYTDTRARLAISATGDVAYNDSTGIISFSLSNHNTDDIAEGTTNKYFTATRVHDAISLTSDNTDAMSYDAITGEFTFSLATVDTDEIAEGPTNFYFTTSRARNVLSAGSNIDYDAATGIISTDAAVVSVNGMDGIVVLTTDDITEGSTNEYFTAARAQAAITVVTDNQDILSYVTGTGTLTFATPTTDAITEGATNLYYTDARADARIAAASVFDLSDVNSGVMTDGYTLVWSSALQKFVPQNIAVTATTLNFTGDGSTLSFNTGVEVSSIDNTQVYINGLMQAPTYSYTLSTVAGETSIVFDAAPELNDYIFIRVSSTSSLTAGGVLNESSQVDGGGF